jgi:hypothetical protein
VLRASAAAERAGIPTASLVCEGFLRLAELTAVGMGLPGIPLAKVPGHVGVQSGQELRANIMTVTLDAVVQNLTEEVASRADQAEEPSPQEVVFTGTLDEVDAFFYEREWSDGLPFVPPTADRVEAFLRYTDLPPQRCLAVLPPDHRMATIWSVAVNGAMAGCRPEYMPVLIALVEALADPQYGVEHSGNTPGSETLVMLDGPIVKDLGFNFEQGVLRDGFRPNTSVGRFLRLYLRNVAGFLPHKTDKATFGGTWRVVLAENEDVLGKIGWEPVCTDVGFQAGENVVTIARYTGGSVISGVTGSTPETMLPYVADAVLKQNGWEVEWTVGLSRCALRPLLVLSPILAETIARAGWSRDDVKQYLFEHCRLPAWKFERYVSKFAGGFLPHRKSLLEMAELDEIPRVFGVSGDSGRMVPIVCEPKAFMIAVAGDPMRTSAYTFSHNGILGYTVGKRITLPKRWNELPKRSR